ncbi:MAG: hypothetical protein INR62_05200, partial [Rhodospirillales bacterium]|nr:hypothetical protein [Acetobacter sp.]
MGKENHTLRRSFDLLEFGGSNVFTQEPADFSFLHPLRPTLLFTVFWRFAAERQRVFWRRVAGLPPLWTSDPVLAAYKFTNTYRASDRVSQYLIRSVQYEGTQEPRELFFRTLLFKLFNRVETWELLQRQLGKLHTEGFNVERYDRVLAAALDRGERVYSAAYIMPSGGKGTKHRMHLELLARMLRDELPERIAGMGTMAQAFAALRAYPTVGDFLAYQYITDINYSTLTGFSETEFVAPGPGALSGLRKCFTDTSRLTDAEVIRLVQEWQQDCFAMVGVTFPSLPGRALQLIDMQNLFCEVDKYARVAYPQLTSPDGRSRIKQRFLPAAKVPPLWYPPKWGLNG